MALMQQMLHSHAKNGCEILRGDGSAALQRLEHDFANACWLFFPEKALCTCHLPEVFQTGYCVMASGSALSLVAQVSSCAKGQELTNKPECNDSPAGTAYFSP